MISTEHAETAREFLIASDREFDQGDILQRSRETLGSRRARRHGHRAGSWVASQQSPIPKASRDTRSSGNERTLSLKLVSDSPRKFHRHFYHDSMEDFERQVDRPHVKRFVERMLDAQ